MAWQNSSSMAVNGGPSGGGGNDGSSQGNQPQGTEYTLQGEFYEMPPRFFSCTLSFSNTVVAKIDYFST